MTEEEVQETNEEPETEEQEPEGFSPEYVKQLRSEAAKYRKQLRQKEQEEQEREQQKEEERKAKLEKEQRLEEENEQLKGQLASEKETSRKKDVTNAALGRVSAVGGKPERASALLRLADLSEVEVSDGSPDTSAIDTALKAALEDYPEFKAGETTIGGGSNSGTGASSDENELFANNPWSPAYRNLTKQGEIIQRDPALAERLRKAAASS